MSSQVNRSEYESLYEHKAKSFEVGNRYGILTKISCDERTSYTLKIGILTWMELESRLFIINDGYNDLAFKLNKDYIQLRKGRSIYETVLVTI